MQRRFLFSALVSLTTLSFAGLAHAQAPVPLRVLTHSSFDLPKELLAQFEKDAGARLQIVKAGDAGEMTNKLILTKALGVGIYSAAFKKSALSRQAYDEFIATTTLLNRVGAKLARESAVHAMTDVTGFGLLGHLMKMMRASGTTAVVDAAAVPYVDGARSALADGFVPGGSRRNLDWVRPRLDASVDEDELVLLADAQTSGGLLVVGELPGHPVVGEVVDTSRIECTSYEYGACTSGMTGISAASCLSVVGSASMGKRFTAGVQKRPNSAGETAGSRVRSARRYST